MKFVINGNESLAEGISKIREMYAKKKYVKVTITSGRDRSLDQNALFHKWCERLTVKGGEFSANGYRNFCRLHFFVPVLLEENQEFAEFWFRMFPRVKKTSPQAADRYQLQLDLLDTFSGISSICTVEQFSTALNRMSEHYATLTTDPVFLEEE